MKKLQNIKKASTWTLDFHPKIPKFLSNFFGLRAQIFPKPKLEKHPKLTEAEAEVSANPARDLNLQMS